MKKIKVSMWHDPGYCWIETLPLEESPRCEERKSEDTSGWSERSCADALTETQVLVKVGNEVVAHVIYWHLTDVTEVKRPRYVDRVYCKAGYEEHPDVKKALANVGWGWK